ncbi:hypothetical protein EV359DRAFT_83336 [Lentinula novae-zelandiae]|nr:hypothetical protein EV359DRAFT_83336 [Lentinula novae-zelandiae]
MSQPYLYLPFVQRILFEQWDINITEGVPLNAIAGQTSVGEGCEDEFQKWGDEASTDAEDFKEDFLEGDEDPDIQNNHPEDLDEGEAKGTFCIYELLSSELDKGINPSDHTLLYLTGDHRGDARAQPGGTILHKVTGTLPLFSVIVGPESMRIYTEASTHDDDGDNGEPVMIIDVEESSKGPLDEGSTFNVYAHGSKPKINMTLISPPHFSTSPASASSFDASPNDDDDCRRGPASSHLRTVLDTGCVFFDHPTAISLFKPRHKQLSAVAMLSAVTPGHERL